MPPGKMAAQAGHAFLDSYLQAHSNDPDRAAAYLASRDGRTDGLCSGTKVALRARNVAALLKAQYELELAGIPCALITDSGHVLAPHFDGSPVVTALGIGPALRSEVRHITDRFALVP